MYLSRVAAVNAGITQDAPALTVNRLCGSGLQAIVSAAQAVTLGDADIAVAGGAESMSRAGYLASGMRWGARMGDSRHDRHDDRRAARPVREHPHGHDGGEPRGSRTRSPAASRMTSRCCRTSAPPARSSEGRFKSQILPVTLKTRKGETVFDTDEHVRAEAKAEDLGKLRPVFKKDGTVTAGNASGINDGAAAVVLMDGDTLAKRGAEPLGRLVAYAHAGVDPEGHGHRPGAGDA